ncbi:hypothetical protein [Marinicella sp. W31]|uniref:hypothetical protein n=1 Tax=Marinicella sp. W31 TaxID=3023713 RepID=UPI003757B48E
MQTVGPDANCDFDTTTGQTLQQALTTTGVTEVRLIINEVYNGGFIIDKPLQITGGYDNCIDATQNIPSQSLNAKSTLSGQNTERVIDIINCSQGSVVLDSLQISDGNSDNLGITRGAGINTINSTCDLIVRNSNISSNTGLVGSGIFYDGLGTGSVFIQDSFFYNNATSNSGRDAQGGGIYSFSSLTIVGNSGFYDNTSGRGGAIFMRGDRYPGDVSLTIIGGDDLPNVGFFRNEVRGFLNGSFGGAIYMRDLASAQLTGHRETFNGIEYGDDAFPITFDRNSANGSSNRGGGIYLTTSSLDISNSQFFANSAGTGGAIAFDSNDPNSMLNIDANPEQCWREQGCNTFIENVGGGGGAIWSINNAKAHIKHSYFSGNSANTGTSIAIGNSADFILESSIIYKDTQNANILLDRSIISASDSSFTILYSTIVENDASEAVFNSVNGGAGHTVYNSIIYNENAPNISTGTVSNQFDCVLADRQDSQLINITATEYADLFVDSTNQDFRLKRSAVAVDLCADVTTINSVEDIQGLARGYDLPDIPNLSGTFDAGANEFNDDLIFRNSFE